MNKNNLPEKYVTIIALLTFGDVPPVPMTGFIAETSDTHEPYFHAFNRRGYDVSLIAKWDYLGDVLPGYCIATHHKNKGVLKPMEMQPYQEQAFTTATESSRNLYYMTLGLTGEAGEIANKVKKVMRDGKALDLDDIKKEIGDVLWYVAGLCTVTGIPLEEVAKANLEKLADRQKRGVIGGSGDNR